MKGKSEPQASFKQADWVYHFTLTSLETATEETIIKDIFYAIWKQKSWVNQSVKEFL